MSSPSWFKDNDIKGGRAVAMMRKYGIDPCDQFGRLVLIEVLAARERARKDEGFKINSPWAVFSELVFKAAGVKRKDGSDREPLAHSVDGEKIKDDLARRGELR